MADGYLCLIARVNGWLLSDGSGPCVAWQPPPSTYEWAVSGVNVICGVKCFEWSVDEESVV